MQIRIPKASKRCCWAERLSNNSGKSNPACPPNNDNKSLLESARGQNGKGKNRCIQDILFIWWVQRKNETVEHFHVLLVDLASKVKYVDYMKEWIRHMFKKGYKVSWSKNRPKKELKNTLARRKKWIEHNQVKNNLKRQYSADLNYPDKTNKTWIFKRVFLKYG